MRKRRRQNSGNRRSYTHWWTTSSKLIKIYNILHTGFGGKLWQGQQESVMHWDEMRRKLIKQWYSRETHYTSRVSRSEHVYTWQPLFLTKEDPSSQSDNSCRPWPQPITGPDKNATYFRQGTEFFLHISWLLESPEWS